MSTCREGWRKSYPAVCNMPTCQHARPPAASDVSSVARYLRLLAGARRWWKLNWLLARKFIECWMEYTNRNGEHLAYINHNLDNVLVPMRYRQTPTTDKAQHFSTCKIFSLSTPTTHPSRQIKNSTLMLCTDALSFSKCLVRPKPLSSSSGKIRHVLGPSWCNVLRPHREI